MAGVATRACLAPGDSSAPLAEVCEGRTVLRRQALRNERHVVMQGDDWAGTWQRYG